MNGASKVEFRYQPVYCAVLRKHVWAILMQQSDGTWRIVNCLDKDEGCFTLDCAFTTSGGQWPYASPPQCASCASDSTPQ